MAMTPRGLFVPPGRRADAAIFRELVTLRRRFRLAHRAGEDPRHGRGAEAKIQKAGIDFRRIEYDQREARRAALKFISREHHAYLDQVRDRVRRARSGFPSGAP
jgi:hypothetical protein